MDKPYYQDNHIKIYNKDCRNMSELPDNSVQCVVTSPPYWGLRKYSGEQELIWGGDKDCEHQWQVAKGTKDIGRDDAFCGGLGSLAVDEGTKGFVGYKKPVDTALCSLCGAWKGAYGLEPTPEMYIEHTIEILREIRRVLRKDGVVFWDIGDSYNSVGGNVGGGKNIGMSVNGKRQPQAQFKQLSQNLKPKDLCLIPFRVAIAAQEDGWWVRSVIIWSKPNPMPESVTDRPTESHEYILMLTKSARYYWDADAVREKNSEGSIERFGITSEGQTKKWNTTNNKRDGRDDGTKSTEGFRDYVPIGRNIRSVWEFPTQPYPEAHFAVFPEKLPEICIKAATPEVGCCSKCGAPWERVIEKGKPILNAWSKKGAGNYDIKIGDWKETSLEEGSTLKHSVPHETLGWQPTCKCNADKIPSLVLDPFMGAGTMLLVAKKLNRYAVGYEISEEYCDLAIERNRQQAMSC